MFLCSSELVNPLGVLVALAETITLSNLWKRKQTFRKISLNLLGHIRILGIRLELARNRGSYAENIICVWKDSRASLGCKLVPVQYRESEYDLIRNSSGFRSSRCLEPNVTWQASCSRSWTEVVRRTSTGWEAVSPGCPWLRWQGEQSATKEKVPSC